jgi:hypothetical protein
VPSEPDRRPVATRPATTPPCGGRAFFLKTADQMVARGLAARAARRHLSSRVNALTRLPGAARHGGLTGIRTLARHAFDA